MTKSNKIGHAKVKRKDISIKVNKLDTIIPVDGMTFILGRDVSPKDFEEMSRKLALESQES